jgi:hypothetical protein
VATYRARPVGQARLLTVPGSPVDRLVQRIGRRTRGEALQLHRARNTVRTGDYEAHMREAEPFRHPDGPGSRVVNDSDHALILELGTTPHVIVPRRPGGLLRFPTAGGVVYTRRVNHPGTRPYRLLTDALGRAVTLETGA